MGFFSGLSFPVFELALEDRPGAERMDSRMIAPEPPTGYPDLKAGDTTGVVLSYEGKTDWAAVTTRREPAGQSQGSAGEKARSTLVIALTQLMVARGGAASRATVSSACIEAQTAAVGSEIWLVDGERVDATVVRAGDAWAAEIWLAEASVSVSVAATFALQHRALNSKVVRESAPLPSPESYVVELRERDVAQLADDVLSGRWESAIERCHASAGLASDVSQEVSRLLIRRAAAHVRATPAEESVWPIAQHGVVALAGVPGAGANRLASALLEACLRESVSGEPTALQPTTLRWLLTEVEPEIKHRVTGLDSYEPKEPWLSVGAISSRFIATALWNLPGEAGTRWFIRLLEHHDIEMKFRYQHMRVGKLPPWSPADWISRLNALSDAAFKSRPGMLTVFGMGQKPPPKESAPAQVRLACTYAADREDYLLRAVAEHLSSYRTGDPATDVNLFWWNAPPEQLELLAWIIELSGSPDARMPVVAAAASAGLIDAQTESVLAASSDRPAWADGEVPWEVKRIVDAGSVRTPDGKLSGGDPAWSFEGLDFTIESEPGEYPVRVIVAEHPLYGKGNAAAELIIDADAEVLRWDLLRDRRTWRGIRR